MKQFDVTVKHVETYTMVLQVDAETEDEARRIITTRLDNMDISQEKNTLEDIEKNIESIKEL